jgi:hypothetical protein
MGYDYFFENLTLISKHRGSGKLCVLNTNQVVVHRCIDIGHPGLSLACSRDYGHLYNSKVPRHRSLMVGALFRQSLQVAL